MSLNEHELAVLVRDVPSDGLHAGDVGTVVHVYEDGRGFEVEFEDIAGETVAVVTVRAEDVRPLRPGERAMPRVQAS